MKTLRFNQAQIKALANLFFELAKWLLLAAVFSPIFAPATVAIEMKRIIAALIYAFVLIAVAMFLLKEVKNDG